VSLVLAVSRGTARAAGIAPTRISLPQGPGSVEGLGRSFVPSLASGTAAFGVDIAVPPAAGGFAPKLGLDYDGGSGVSEVGLGWRMSGLPSIRVRTESGLPKFDASDAFELVGLGIPSDLLLMPDGYFRAQYEAGVFARVAHDAGSSEWEARTKDGVTYRFGGGAEFLEAEGDHTATYLLREMVDLHGHRIAYTWDTSEGHALLTSVVWNDFSAKVRQRIEITYEARPDVHTLFSSGIKKVLSRRAKAISVTLGGELVRRYTLGYAPGNRSQVVSVAMVGTDGVTALPTLTLSYTEPSFAADGQTTRMGYPPYWSPADPDVALADLNGDGLPDLFVGTAGNFHTVINHDGTTWKTADDWGENRSPSLSLSATGVGLADLDGDGALDLFAKSGTDSFRYLPGRDASAFFDAVYFSKVPNFSFEDPDVHLADLDGDRRPDVVLTTESGLAVSYNLNGKDWAKPEVIGEVDPAQKLRFSDGHTELCDVNGDRVLDLCYLRSQGLAFWLGRGRGVFEPARQASGVPNFDITDPWKLVDLNGDGWVDLVHVGATQVDYALALSEGAFGDVRTIAGVPKKERNVSVQFADMNGSGTTDILWITTSTKSGIGTDWSYLELFPDGRSGLLKVIDNGLGKVARITYASAASNAAAAREAGNPWTARMNVAMPVVARVEVDDQLGDPLMATTYSYRDGTWDANTRTFAGFAAGTQQELGDTWTPTLLTASSFDVGIKQHVLRGAILTMDQRDANGNVFSRTTNQYKSATLGTSVDGRSIEYAYKSDELVQHIEGVSDAEARSTEKSWLQDDFGNVVAEYDWGEVLPDDPAVGNDEAIIARTFASNVDDWILGRLATEELTDVEGNRVSMRRLYYDGKAFQGLALGNVLRGDVSRVEAWTGPAAKSFELENSTSYDADGNPLETRDARGGGRYFEFDPEDHTTLLSERVKLEKPVQLIEFADTDRRFGNLRSIVDYAGQRTAFRYDALGRVVEVYKPGDPEGEPSTHYTYSAAAPLSRVVTESRVWYGRAELERTEMLFDGLGRKRGALTRDNNGRWVLAGVSLLDARGKERKALRPRFVTSKEVASPPLLKDAAGTTSARDALGRETQTTSQSGITTRTEYLPFLTRRWDGGQTDANSPYEHTPEEQAFDGRGRVIAATRTLNGTPVSAAFTYDPAGRLLTRTDPEQNVAAYAYDGRGRRVAIVDPDLGTRTSVYDATGNLVEKHFPDAIAKYTFDLAGRSLSEDWDGDGKPEVTRTWDSSSEHPARLLDRGKLVLVTEPSGSTSHEYDERGRVAATTVTIDGKPYTSGSRYDNQDREAEHIYPDGSSIRIDRNARGQLASYANGAVSFDYDGDGLELTRRFGTGVVQTNGYDADRRLNELTATDAHGEVIEHLKWTFDAAGNVSNLDDLRANVPQVDDRSEAYVYDNLYRLTGAQGAWGHTEWKYSPSGNLLERTSTVPSQQSGTIEYAGPAPHAPSRFGGRTVVFDQRGRLTSDGDRTYTWNAAEQLESVASKSGAAEENKFDAEGIRRVRVEKANDGTERRVEFISPWSEVEDGKLVRFIVHGGRRIVRLAENNGAASGSGGKKSEGSLLAPFGKSAALGRALGNFGQLAMAALALIALAWRSRDRWFPALARIAPALALLLLVIGCGGDGPGLGGTVAPEDRGTVHSLSEGDTVLISDQLGSLLAEASPTKGVSGRFAAYPFGATRYDSSPQTRKFANSTRDRGVGLDLMGARVYAPDLGIWTSGDPVLVNAPEKVATSDFATANPHAYANLNPIAAADEDGHFWHILAGAAIGAVVGGGIEAARQYIANGKIEDWGRVGAAAAGGAVSGALTAACPAAGLAGVMAVGAGSSAAAGVTQRLVESGGQSAGTLKEVVVDATVGAATAGLAKGVMAVGKAVVQRVAPKAAGAVTKVASQCFAGETLVDTAEGLRRIDEIRPGDLVLSRDEETGVEELRSVVQVFVTAAQPLVEVRISGASGDTEVVRATSEHPFWVDGRGWVAAGALICGDKLIDNDQASASVIALGSVGTLTTVYNLEVDGLHTYFVGRARAWVHNACGENGAHQEGSFSISDWSGYPQGIPRPTGTVRLIAGEEYNGARAAANQANRAMHKADASLAGQQIHEIKPVKFSGSPTDPANKIPLTPQQHQPVSTWWNRLQRAVE
jgi:RHS repeat-associated protein